MNERQERALELMRAPPKSTGYQRRDLYELGNPDGSGSGRYGLSYTAARKYEALTQQDVDGLLAAGLIKQKWPGCYELAGEASNG